jgi:hypothetical protein
MDVDCSRLKGGEQLGNRMKQQITLQELNGKQDKEASTCTQFDLISE